jgi:hypothetical protein
VIVVLPYLKEELNRDKYWGNKGASGSIYLPSCRFLRILSIFYWFSI